MSAAVKASCEHIERALSKSSAFSKVDEGLYVIKQGSSFVMISVVATQKSKQAERVVVRLVAQVVQGVRAEPSLMRQLLLLNAKMRFGAFAYTEENETILFIHNLLGGAAMDEKELFAAVHDVALVADHYDDRIVARYGGSRMQDVVERNALANILGGNDLLDEDLE